MRNATSEKALRGIFAPLTTPFDGEQALDTGALAENMAFYAQSGLQGYLVLGSNGENKSLDGEEKFRVLETVMKTKAPGQVVMTGCIAESTRETLRLARRAAELGSDYITLLPPSYFKKQMSDEVLEAYFTEVASGVSAPCLLYNAPGFSGGVTLSAALVNRLARHPNIVGIKDSSTGNLDTYLMQAPEGFAVLAGSINMLVSGLMGGAAGGIVSLANIFPGVVLALYRLFEEGKYEDCFALNRRLLRVNRAVSGSGGVTATKAAMDLAGLRGGAPRRPLPPPNDALRDRLLAALQKENML